MFGSRVRVLPNRLAVGSILIGEERSFFSRTHYRWRWREDESGNEFGFYGEYRVVDAPHIMVQNEYYDPGSFGGAMPTSSTITRTTFTEQNGVTTLVTLITYGSKDERDAAISTGMTDGMETSYERLDRLVSESTAQTDTPPSAR